MAYPSTRMVDRTALQRFLACLVVNSLPRVFFSHSLNRVSGTRTDGKEIDMYWRATVCYRKIDGKWVVTHEHNSVPFDPESGRASLDFKP